MKESKLIGLLITSAYTLYTTNLNNHYHYFTDIKEGDLVMEISSMFMESYNNDRIGYLKEKNSDSDCVIETLDGKVVRWENAEFIKVPTALREIERK